MKFLKILLREIAAELRGILRSIIRAFLIGLAVALAGALGVEGYLNLTPSGKEIKQTIQIVNAVSVNLDPGELPILIERLQRWLDSEGIAR